MTKEGRHKEGLNQLLLLDVQEDSNKFERLKCELLKSKLLMELGRIKESLELAKECLKSSKNLKLPLSIVDALIIISHSLWYLGKYDESSKSIQKGLKTLENCHNDEKEVLKRKALLLIQKGHILVSLSQFDNAFTAFETSLKIGNKIKFNEGVAESLGDIGVIFLFEGDVNKALEYSIKSLNLFKKIGNIKSSADACANISNIHIKKGDLNQAEIYVETAIRLYTIVGNSIGVAGSLGNLGEIKFQKNDVIGAIKHYEEAKSVFESIENKYYLAKVLLKLIITVLYNDQLPLAEKYLYEFKQIAQNTELRLVKQRYKLANALILKKTNTTKNLIIAERILREIAEEIVIHHRITILALINLCELLISKLRKNPRKIEILKEIQQIINKLLSIANEQNSTSLIIEIYLLQSKMALLQMNTDFAKSLLTQALEIAENKGLSKLAIVVSNEYDSLLNKIEKYKDKTDSNINKRLEYFNFEDSLSNIITRRSLINSIAQIENPIFFFIIHRNGLCVYSREFKSDHSFSDETLIERFLAIANGLLNHIFTTSSRFMERIKYQDYTLIIKAIEPLLFCYVFIGQSYHAKNKLKRIITFLQETKDYWDLLVNVSERGSRFSLKENNQLNFEIDLLIKKSTID